MNVGYTNALDQRSLYGEAPEALTSSSAAPVAFATSPGLSVAANLPPSISTGARESLSTELNVLRAWFANALSFAWSTAPSASAAAAPTFSDASRGGMQTRLQSVTLTACPVAAFSALTAAMNFSGGTERKAS